MCNRYEGPDLVTSIEKFVARPSKPINAGPQIIHPKDPGLVVLDHGEGLVIEQMLWGFPIALKGKNGQMLKPKPVNNARFDKLNGYWRRWAALPAQRCLIPATRFAEAVGQKGRMTETWLSVKGSPLFAWAGLWRTSEEWGECYTGVMTDAAPELMEIHDRSPVILHRDDWQTWLTAPLSDLFQFDRPLPAAAMEIDATERLWAR